MKEKIICFLIITTLLFVVIPPSMADNNEIKCTTLEKVQLKGYFIFGFMQLINPEESRSEFEIVSFIVLFGNGETIRLTKGEMIKLHGPIFGIIYNNLFVGYIGDYSIIG